MFSISNQWLVLLFKFLMVFRMMASQESSLEPVVASCRGKYVRKRSLELKQWSVLFPVSLKLKRTWLCDSSRVESFISSLRIEFEEYKTGAFSMTPRRTIFLDSKNSFA